MNEVKYNNVTAAVKRKCVEMARSGKTYREIYTEYYSKHYDTKYEGFRSMIKRWKKKTYADDELLESVGALRIIAGCFYMLKSQSGKLLLPPRLIPSYFWTGRIKGYGFSLSE